MYDIKAGVRSARMENKVGGIKRQSGRGGRKPSPDCEGTLSTGRPARAIQMQEREVGRGSAAILSRVTRAEAGGDETWQESH